MIFGFRSEVNNIKELLCIKTGITHPLWWSESLGLWLDTTLRFTKHGYSLCRASLNSLRQLYTSRNIVSTSNMTKWIILTKNIHIYHWNTLRMKNVKLLMDHLEKSVPRILKFRVRNILFVTRFLKFLVISATKFLSA